MAPFQLKPAENGYVFHTLYPTTRLGESVPEMGFDMDFEVKVHRDPLENDFRFYLYDGVTDKRIRVLPASKYCGRRLEHDEMVEEQYEPKTSKLWLYCQEVQQQYVQIRNLIEVL